MNADQNRELWERGMAFLGRVMAGQSHEVTNVLNIINELAGLLGDLIAAAEQGRPLDLEKLNGIVTKIGRQIQRGEEMVRALNRFGHTTDHPRALFDLRDLLDRIVYLAQRPARLGKTQLEAAFPAETVSLESSPLGFVHAVHTAIEVALGAADQERTVTVSYGVAEETVTVEVRSADPIGVTEQVREKLAFLGLLMTTLRGRVVAAPGAGDAHRLVLQLPREAGTIQPGSGR